MADPAQNSRDDNIYFARLSEQGERYEDMIKYMKAVARVSLLYYKNHSVFELSIVR
jgi:hypothetical protein